MIVTFFEGRGSIIQILIYKTQEIVTFDLAKNKEEEEEEEE